MTHPELPGNLVIETRNTRVGRRRGGLHDQFHSNSVTCADILSLEHKTKKYDCLKLTAYLPLILSVLWIFGGTVFYAVHDNLDWPHALFMSVNAGWSIGFPMTGLSEFDSPMSKFFTIYHTSVGVLFAGVTVLYIAQEVGKNKDNWIKQIIKKKELHAAADTEGCWDSVVGHMKVHFPTLRIIALFIAWLAFGLLWFPITNSEYTVAKNVDFVLSTLTTGGYVAIPSTVDGYQFVVTALYANFGVPLLSIAMGLFVSFMLEAPEDNLIYHQIIAPVTAEEISFMQEFHIENGDGIVDSKEFIILAVVRIGSASPELIRRINERFKQLDRKRKGKILYDDIILSRRKPPLTLSLEDSPTGDMKQKPRGSSFTGGTSVFTRSRNNSLFKSRAKSVHEGSSTEAEIAANIAKIESFSKTPSPVGSGNSSYRITSGRVVSYLYDGNDSDGGVSRDGDYDDGDVEAPSWRKPYPRASSRASSTSHRSKLGDLERQNSFDSQEKSKIFDSPDHSYRNKRNGKDVHVDRSILSVAALLQNISSLGESHGDSEEEHAKGNVDDNDMSLMSGSSSDDGGLLPTSKTLLSAEMSPASSHTQHSDKNDADEEENSAEEQDVEMGPISDDIQAQNAVLSASSLQTQGATNKFKLLVKSQIRKNRTTKPTMADIVKEVASHYDDKHHSKMENAKRKRRKSLRIEYKNRKKSRWELMRIQISEAIKSWSAIAVYVWFLWLTVGTIFFSLEENVTVCQGIFVSTSIGYGIFWYDQTSTNAYARLFSTVHFLIGYFGVGMAMALFARSLVSMKGQWYDAAKQKRSIEAALATEDHWAGLVAAFKHHWPYVYVHVYFVLWMVLGIVWGVTSIKWSVLDAWLFCMTAMATGGLVSLPSSGVGEWDYVFVSVYIIVGAPLMAISCGVHAHNISNYGRTSKFESLLSAAVREDELAMMQHLGIEEKENDAMDEGVFAILILVRIGALNPDLIGVLFDRYHDLARDGAGNVTYESLSKADAFIDAKMLMPISFRMSSLTDSFKEGGSLVGSALVKKLRLDSIGA